MMQDRGKVLKRAEYVTGACAGNSKKREYEEKSRPGRITVSAAESKEEKVREEWACVLTRAS
jgi:hypothetical protein